MFKAIQPASVGFNAEELEHAHMSSTFSISNDFKDIRFAYYRFFARLMERVQNDPGPLKIREIEKFLKTSARIRRDPAYVWEPLEAAPFRMLTILQNGDVTPFSPELAGVKSDIYHNFKIGNICEQSLEQIARTLDASLLKAHAQASRETCKQQCGDFQLCGGTYFSNKWTENNDLLVPETLACRLHSQAVIDAFLDHIGA